ncbi:MAG: hypothetical protein Q9209_006283 [Squamulea sp. 1 TL-2023]
MSDEDSLYQRVQARAAELRGQIDELRKMELDATARDAAVTRCLTEITNLTNEIRCQAHSTAPHDQRTYNEVWLRGLHDQLQKVRSEIAPRRKFAFKSTPKPMPVGPKPKVPGEVLVAGHSNQSTDEKSSQDHPSESGGTSSSPTSHSFANVSNTICLIPNPTKEGGGIVLADSSCCVIKCPGPVQSLMIKDIQKRVPEGAQTNMWDQVNDFNWLKAGHNPNWSVLDLASRFGADQWNIIQGLTEGEPVDTVLARLNIN